MSSHILEEMDTVIHIMYVHESHALSHDWTEVWTKCFFDLCWAGQWMGMIHENVLVPLGHWIMKELREIAGKAKEPKKRRRERE